MLEISLTLQNKKVKTCFIIKSIKTFHNFVLDIDLKTKHWGPPRAITSEYKTYSTAQVEVYRDNQPISSTDNGVRI